MKIVEDKNSVTSSGTSNERSFQIKMGAKAFKVLSDGLYKNKIGSLVREISCNAKDALSEANRKSVPFEIHLPDTFEPWFSVEDTGLGIHDDIIADVFCTLFESTKDDSNDSVGAFGLGSKTPFAYDSQFLITSTYEGVRCQYSAFLDPTGLPTIALMGDKVETTEHEGVKIQVPVQKDDFREFRDEVRRQLKFFSVKPTILNCADFEWDEIPEPSLVIGTVKLLDEDNSSYSNCINILQGEVRYILENDLIREKLSDLNVETYDFINKLGATIEFEIGQIGVIPSREGIEYVDQTIANIETKIERFRVDLVDEVEKKMDGMDSTWEKVIALNNDRALRQLVKASDYEMPEHVTLNYQTYSFSLKDYFTKNVTEQITLADGTKKNTDYLSRKFKIVKYKEHAYSETVGIDTNASTDDIAPDGSNLHAGIFIRDTNKQPLIRIKHYMQENELKELYVVMVGSDNKQQGSPDVAFNAKVVRKIKKLLGGAKVTRVSKLDAPSNAVKSNYTKTMGYTLTPEIISDAYFSTNSTFDWTRIKGALADVEPSVYVECDRYDIQDTKGSLERIRQLAKLGLVEKQLYAFNRVNTQKIEALDTWVHVDEYVTELEVKFADMLEPCRELVRLKKIEEAIGDYKINQNACDELYEHIKKADKGSDGRWFIKASKKLPKICNRLLNKISRDIHKVYDNFRSEVEDQFSDLTNSSVDKHFGDDDVIERLKKCSTRFQLIPQQYSFNSEEIEHIFEYVNCMSERDLT